MADPAHAGRKLDVPSPARRGRVPHPEGSWHGLQGVTLVFWHIKFVLSGADPEVYEYVVKFLAWVLQGRRPPVVALCFAGPRAIGKTAFAYRFLRRVNNCRPGPKRIFSLVEGSRVLAREFKSAWGHKAFVADHDYGDALAATACCGRPLRAFLVEGSDARDRFLLSGGGCERPAYLRRLWACVEDESTAHAFVRDCQQFDLRGFDIEAPPRKAGRLYRTLLCLRAARGGGVPLPSAVCTSVAQFAT